MFPALRWEGQVGMQDPPFCIHGYRILTWAGGSEHPSIYTGCYGRGWVTKITERDSQRPPRAHGAE